MPPGNTPHPDEETPRLHRRPLQGLLRSYAGNPDLFGSERSFNPPVGSKRRGRDATRGYYIDFRIKAETPEWPPYWLQSSEQQLHIATAQWGLGAYERFLTGDGDAYLAGAIGAADHLVAIQHPDGGWRQHFSMPHTYHLDPPWISGITQGEGASLLVRIHAATGDQRYAEAAARAVEIMDTPVDQGGCLADLHGVPFLEEYPTSPSSFVLNGAIFAILGYHDLGLALGDSSTRERSTELARGLADNLWRYDTGHWSRYDLYPHPLPNLASPAYHLLHINLLTVLDEVEPSAEFAPVISRFERYRASRVDRTAAIVRKVAFRAAVPRSPSLAHRLPWSAPPSQDHITGGPDRDILILCYHAVSTDWAAALSVTPTALARQLELVLSRGYRPVTFTEAATAAPEGKIVAVTFDDAYASVVRHAEPIMSGLGYVGTVFAPTGLMDEEQPLAWPGVDRWIGGEHESELLPMGWPAARSLAGQGWEIGSHTVTHPRLPALPQADLISELRNSRSMVAEQIGRRCLSIAYPYGSVDARVVKATIEAGYSAAGALPAGRFQRSVFTAPRIGIYHSDGEEQFRLKISPAFRALRSSSAWTPLAAGLRAIRGAASGTG